MTSPEHTLVGIHFAFALGLHRFAGWRGVVLSAIASNVPDWDGIPMLFDMSRFESGHRVWGHGILSILLTSLVMGWTQSRCDWIGGMANLVQRVMPKTTFPFTLQEPVRSIGSVNSWGLVLIGLCAQLIHLPCDMVVSGGNGLSDWAIQPWWPFSNAAYVYPLIPWGDAGPTVVLMTGILVIAKRNSDLSRTSWLTIVVLWGYLFVRGWFRGAFTF